MTYKKEERFELRYIGRDGKEHSCFPRSAEGKEEQLKRAKEAGLRVLFCRKLYPFNTERNQHNFMLIANKCSNLLHDMDMGEIAYTKETYSKLWDMKTKAEEFFCLDLPVAWLPWEEWKAAKEMATEAVILRQEACIAAGRPDLVQYC